MNDKNKRNEVFDLVRGIAIILVVIGHSGCPNYLRNLIYLFHMPIFYFISGYFFSKNRNIEIVPFIRRKIYTLYRPFIIYEFIFLILSGLFFQLQLTQEAITLKSIVSKSINILIFKNSFTLLPFWFLRSLFIINIIFLFQYIFVQKLKLNSYLLLIINTLLFIIGSYLCMKKMHQPLELQREFILLYFFTLGYYFTPPIKRVQKNIILSNFQYLLYVPFF